MQIFIKGFTVVGVAVVMLFVLGFAVDINGFDTTSGGYEPPYTDYVGEPIDWGNMDVTETGVVQRGYVINTHVNGTTGMISFEIFGQWIDYRPLSERALAIHNPRKAFIELGFNPQF